MNSALYYVVVINEKYKNGDENIGKFLSAGGYVTKPHQAEIYTHKKDAERKLVNDRGTPLEYLSVVPLTMSW